jgi:hypothetical protein
MTRRHKGVVYLKLHAFYILALHGDESSLLRSALFIPADLYLQEENNIGGSEYRVSTN